MKNYIIMCQVYTLIINKQKIYCMNQSFHEKNAFLRKNDLLAPSIQKSIYYYRNKSHQQLRFQNQKVLSKLVQISQRKPMLSFSCSKTASKSTFYRKKQLKNIEQENIKIGTRLIALPSTFHRDQMRKEIKDYQQLKRRLTNNRRHAFNVVSHKIRNQALPRLREHSIQSPTNIVRQNEQPSQQFFWQKGRSKTEEITFHKSKNHQHFNQKSYSQSLDDKQNNHINQQNLPKQDSMNIQVLLQEVSTQEKKQKKLKRNKQDSRTFAQNYQQIKSSLFN